MNSAPSSKGCPQEASVLTAARTGQWDEALEAHAAACPACGEVALVSGSLRTFALETDGHNRLPDPYLVWLKAKLTERQVASQRASKPWDMAEALGQFVVAVALAGWLVVEWSSIYPGTSGMGACWPAGRLVAGLVADDVRCELPTVYGVLDAHWIDLLRYPLVGRGTAVLRRLTSQH